MRRGQALNSDVIRYGLSRTRGLVPLSIEGFGIRSLGIQMGIVEVGRGMLAGGSLLIAVPL